tara:strand:- start:481 stop:858 length:378 start_codon:yes stop_codon:yes gene_type:complete
MTDQSIEAHMFLEKHVLVNANRLMDDLIKSNERNWSLEELPWFEDLYLQFEEPDFSEDFDEDNAELKNPYEFYIVSDYFAKKLQEHNELLTNHFGFFIWGRQTTGQHIVLDYVFQQIWKDHLNAS